MIALGALVGSTAARCHFGSLQTPWRSQRRRDQDKLVMWHFPAGPLFSDAASEIER